MINCATRMRHWILILPAVVLLGASIAQAKRPVKPPRDEEEPAGYTLVALDDRAGSVRSTIRDVTSVGGVTTAVGYQAEADGDKAVLWDVTPSESGFVVSTSYLAGGDLATGVTTSGAAVGRCTTFDAATQLWLYCGLYWPNSSATPVSLAPLPGDNQSEPLSLNAAGVIVGRSTHKYETVNEEGEIVEHEDPTAVFWVTDVVDPNGELAAFELNGQPSGFSSAQDINQCNVDGMAEVVGYVVEIGPVFWLIDCETLEAMGPTPLAPADVRGWGNAINGAGEVCGTSSLLAFRVLSDGTFEELAVRRGDTSVANDIGDQRQVVGRVWQWNRTGGLSKTYGAMWRADGTRVDLNKFLGRSDWRYLHAGLAIDATGVIAAIGSLKADGESRALLMIPE